MTFKEGAHILTSPNQTTTTMKDKARTAICHGEALIFTADAIPSDATECKQEGSFTIIAYSKTVGNYHVIDHVAGNTFHESGGKRFLNAVKPTRVRCVNAGRHAEIAIQPGIYEFGIAKEYDPFDARLKNVRD